MSIPALPDLAAECFATWGHPNPYRQTEGRCECDLCTNQPAETDRSQP